MKAIETRYKGFLCRSRTEARWMVFFDAMQIAWQYEPEGYDLGGKFGYYLPDFFVVARKGESKGFWVEVKGQKSSLDEQEKLARLAAGTGSHGFLVTGCPGENYPMECRMGVSGGVVTQEHSEDDPIYALGWSAFVSCCSGVKTTSENVKQAVYAARSARFEHGQSGAMGVWTPAHG